MLRDELGFFRGANDPFAGMGERDDERNGYWLSTYTGRRFWPFDPRPEDFDILDVAHALANLCRFNGHVRRFYSVAQHSVDVFVHVNTVMKDYPDEQRLLAGKYALLHDLPEAYIGDMSRPLKRSAAMTEYCDAEHAIMQAAEVRFGLTEVDEAVKNVVKTADNHRLYIEAFNLMPHKGAGTIFQWHWPSNITSHYFRIPKIEEYLSPQQAEWEFLQVFKSLFSSA